MKVKGVFILILALAMLALVVTPALADQPFGRLYYEGHTVRTIAPPAKTPQEGIDPLYSVANGVEGQLGITAVAPGDTDYHGGHWAIYVVTFNEGVEPYLLTSADAVHDAEQAGDVTVVRNPDADIKCPVQP